MGLYYDRVTGKYTFQGSEESIRIFQEMWDSCIQTYIKENNIIIKSPKVNNSIVYNNPAIELKKKYYDSK